MGKTENKSAAAAAYATYDERHGNRVDLYALGSDDATGQPGSSLRDVADAIRNAKKFIFICDWSFQPYMILPPRNGQPQIEQTVGAVLNARANAGVLVAIHVWDHTNVAAPDDYNDSGDSWLDKIAQQVGYAQARSPNLLWRASSRTLGTSHHQKYVILDFADPVTGKRVIKAFFGGLDLTKGRFAWGEHTFGRKPAPPPAPNTNVSGPFAAVQAIDLGAIASGNGIFYVDDWYNAEFTHPDVPGDATLPRQSWQDYYAGMIGPAAWDLAREFVGRFNSDYGIGGTMGDTSDKNKDDVQNKFKALFSDDEMLKEWEPHQGPFVARVVRSIKDDDWKQHVVTHLFADNETVECNTPTENGSTQTEFKWKLARRYEKSIEQSYVYAIGLADRFIYIESQYFIGSGDKWDRKTVTNGIPEAIVERIRWKIEQGHDFHAYIVIPQFPEGDPSFLVAPVQRHFEWATMRYMVQTVAAAATAKGKDWKDYLSFYFLMNWSGQQPPTMTGGRKERVRANWRYMVYVHSKLMIVDDQYLIVGSANLNERSLSGDRDTEICVYLRPDEGKLGEAQEKISALRKKAWTQHMGALPPSADNPELRACSSVVQQKARENWIAVAAGGPPDGSHLVAFPFAGDAQSFSIEQLSATPDLKEQDLYIFDAPASAAKPPGNGTIPTQVWKWDNVPSSGAITRWGWLAE
jgi:phospholipase D1/2